MMSAVNGQVIHQLGLQPVGDAYLTMFGQPATPVHTVRYAARIIIPDCMHVAELTVIHAELDPRFAAVIGRAILSQARSPMTGAQGSARLPSDLGSE
jgi:hypothetical protein